jgi:hypothetical protein
MFSSRLPDDLAPNRLATAELALRRRGVALLDLTETNPTRVGLPYPEGLLEALADPASIVYAPEPFGLPATRRLVAAEYHAAGLNVDPSHIVLTASTSEAYSLLFKLLCDPGDQVLVPVPSYPLFEYLTRLDLVEARPYPLAYHGTWSIDVGGVEASLGPRTRALVVVSPNNPTGSLVSRRDLDALVAICRDRRLALIGDEVFAEYPIAPRVDAARVAEQTGALTFSLGGLSKSAGLPQVKLGWLSVTGPGDLVRAALARLEVICDTYLSVSTPVQLGAGRLLRGGREVRRLILDRVSGNLEALGTLAARYPACSVLAVEAGWTAVIRVPATRSEDRLVLDLLEQDQVLVHPGYFFDFPCEAFVIVSLLPAPDEFRRGADRLLARACA